jgi:hypothetical protein
MLSVLGVLRLVEARLLKMRPPYARVRIGSVRIESIALIPMAGFHRLILQWLAAGATALDVRPTELI